MTFKIEERNNITVNSEDTNNIIMGNVNSEDINSHNITVGNGSNSIYMFIYSFTTLCLSPLTLILDRFFKLGML